MGYAPGAKNANIIIRKRKSQTRPPHFCKTLLYFVMIFKTEMIVPDKDIVDIHCRKEEEEEFKRSGFLPPHIRDQAITKGVAPDLPALYGARPICKDFLKGDCRRSRNCRFRHLNANM